MDVFDLDQSLIADYERFARSFTQIRAADIRQQIDAIYARAVSARVELEGDSRIDGNLIDDLR